jgi:phage-related protein (TIGR01555 family)
MRFWDSLRSLTAGLGSAKDKGVGYTHVLRTLSAEELSAMHRGDWLARKVVDIIPNDMTREWRDWQAEGDQIGAIEEVEKAPLINLAAKVNQALQTARLFGGSLIYIGIRGDVDLMKPLDIERVGQGDLQYLHVLSCNEVTTGEIVQDVLSEFHGEPSYYEVTGANGVQTRIHPSRVIRFCGAPILDRRTVSGSQWSDSVLQVVYDAVTNATSAQQHIAALIPEAKVDVWYIPGLGAATTTEEGRQKLISRFTFANTAKSMFNAILMDGTGPNGEKTGGEQWEQKQISFAQLPELMQQFLKIAAGAADIPVTRLLGDSPSGLNSTGKSDLQNYYDNIAARQRTELSPALHRLDEIIIRSALGKRDPAIYYEWSPLWGLSENERATIFKTYADGARAIAGTGGMSPSLMPLEALSDALVNRMVEDGALPGLETAIEEFGRLADQEEDPEDEAAALETRGAPSGEATFRGRAKA